MDIFAEKDPVVEFAAAELRKYAIRILGDTGRLPSCAVYLGYTEEFCRKHKIDLSDLRYDGYKIVRVQDGWAFASAYARGVLFAVYDFLTQNGCRFVKAAGVDEIVPHREELRFTETVENPDMQIRGLVNGVWDLTDEWVQETVSIVDWAAKNRLNMFFLHQPLQETLPEKNRAVIDALRLRGMQIEFGGHGVQSFVDRDLFETNPELFIEKDGKRTTQGNFCVSSDYAVAEVTKKILTLLRSCPQIDVLHVWFEDTISGSWCDCDKCRALSPVRQMHRVISHVAEQAAREFPHVKIDLLLYHDTLDHIEEIGDLPPNVLLEFAPRERCYAHALPASECALNAEYVSYLQKAVNCYGGNAVSVFEYYTDFILFSKVKTVFAETIAEDLRYYRDCGVTRIAPLGFGLYGHWAYDVNLAVYARHVFHADEDVSQTVADYIAMLSLPSQYAEYISLCARFSRLYFAFCGYKSTRDDIRALPLCAYFGEHLQKIEEAISVLEKARDLLQTQTGKTDAAQAYLHWQAESLDISLAECYGLYKRMQARYAHYVAPDDEIEPLLQELDAVKSGLYGIIDKIRTVPPDVKGAQGGMMFEEHLCKDQIWTVNELLNKEFSVPVSLDRSSI